MLVSAFPLRAVLEALALTLIIEVPAYAALLRSGLRISAQRGWRAGVAVNLISHPLAFLAVMPWITPVFGFLPALAVVETGVWVLEAALLWVWLRRDPDLLGLAGLLANLASLVVGAALFF